jgi:hypothetical protein
MRDAAAAVAAARDGLLAALAKEYESAEAREPGRRIELLLTNGVLRNPLHLELRRWGGRWLAGSAALPWYNKSKNPVDASGLVLSGDAVRGVVKVTLVSDGWVPPPGVTHDLAFTIDAAVNGDRVTGTYRAAANRDLTRSVPSNQARYDQVVRGPAPRRGSVRDLLGLLEYVPAHQAEHWDVLSGTMGRLEYGVEASPSRVPDVPEGADDAGRYAAAVALERRADEAYRFVRAFSLAGAAGVPFETALGACPDLGAVRPEYDAAKAAERVKAMRERLDRMGEAVAVSGSWRPGDAVCPVNEVTAGDPRFRGYFGSGALACEAGRPNVVPTVETEGAEAWLTVSRWRVLGPFREDPFERTVLPLPDAVPAPDAAARADSKDAAGAAAEWREVEGLPFDFLDIGEVLGQKNHALAYAAADLHSDAEQEAWAALRPRDYCRLWANDRLVWANYYEQRRLRVRRQRMRGDRGRPEAEGPRPHEERTHVRPARLRWRPHVPEDV